jgi:hypothetical protein
MNAPEQFVQRRGDGVVIAQEDAPESGSSPDRGDHVLSKCQLTQHIRKLWADRGYEYPEDDRVGVSIGELVDHSVGRNAALELPFVDLWVAILDECISWFISLYAVVYAERSEEFPATAFEKSIVTILSKIIADSTAVRHLVLAGFDTSARTILRSTSEYMEVLVAIIHQPAFADEFVESDTPETAQTFWETHLRGGKIRRRVTQPRGPSSLRGMTTATLRNGLPTGAGVPTLCFPA